MFKPRTSAERADLCGSKSLGQVVPQVADVLDSDAQPEQSWRQMLLTGDGRTTLDCRFDRAEACRVTYESDTAAYLVGGFRSTNDIEGNEAPEVR
jgi:hypothetical protein